MSCGGTGAANWRVDTRHCLGCLGQDLERDRVTPWDGVRNFKARNNVREMRVGDLGFYYHSNCKVPGVVGMVRVCREAYPDFTALDASHPKFDSKSHATSPRWSMVDVEFQEKWATTVSLREMKMPENSGPGRPLDGFSLLSNSRLSVHEVTPEQWAHICGLAGDARSPSSRGG